MKRNDHAIRSVMLPALFSGFVFLSAMGVVAINRQDSTPSRSEEAIKPLIVMIKSKLPDGEEVGAGIIFGQAANRLYIVTANHVVRQGPQEAKEVRVRFSWLPGQDYEAKLLTDASSDMDWAVLAVENLDKLGQPEGGMPFAQLGNPNLKRRDRVYLIGNPTGHSWDVTVTPDGVTSNAGNSIYFESSHLEPGHSGGALLDEKWEVVGLIKSSQAPHGEALNIQSVLDALRQRRYPVSLKPGEAPVVDGGGGQANKVLLKLEKIVVRQDGSAGATDWVFDVKFNGALLFTVRKSLNDHVGSNIVMLVSPDQAEGVVNFPREQDGATARLARESSARPSREIGGMRSNVIEVLGRRGSGNGPTAVGRAHLTTTGQLQPIEVRNTKQDKDGSFVFYFSATAR